MVMIPLPRAITFVNSWIVKIYIPVFFIFLASHQIGLQLGLKVVTRKYLKEGFSDKIV